MKFEILRNSGKIAAINSYLLAALIFITPFSPSLSSAVTVLIVLLWLMEGNFSRKFDEIKHNKVVLASLAFFAVCLIGLLWTENLKWGIRIMKKERMFLLLPVLLNIARIEHIRYYICTFITAMTLSVFVSFLIRFELLHISGVPINDPSPFMSHIHYNPFLAFAVYLVLFEFLFDDSLSGKYRAGCVALFCIMTAGMFITGGRTGHVLYFFLLSLIIFQYFNRNVLKAAVLTAVVLPLIFVVSYNASPFFAFRVDSIFSDIRNIEENPNTDVGVRIVWFLNSLEIIKKHPVLGVGTGDFPSEYNKVHFARTPNTLTRDQPHNMYILVLVQTGLVGLLTMLSIFLFQIRTALRSEGIYRHIMLALPLMFLVMMLGESYLLTHDTAVLFGTFSGILFKRTS